MPPRKPIAPLIHPPQKTKVGYTNYLIKKEGKAWSDKHNAVGETDTQEHVIHYLDSHHSQVELGNTILHEFLHAITDMNQIQFTDAAQEEHVVASLANGLTTIFVDNPDLAKWFFESVGVKG